MSSQCYFKIVLLLCFLSQLIVLVCLGMGYFHLCYPLMAPYRERKVTTTKIVSIKNSSHRGSRESMKPKAGVKLILVSYMRSGSTFTGDLFNHHPDVFYFYEPFWAVDFLFERRSNEGPQRTIHPALFFNKPMVVKETYTAVQQTAKLKQNVMRSAISCDFESMYIGPLLLPSIYKKSLTFTPFGRCVAQNPDLLGLRRCLPELIKVCRSASVIAMKVLRITMQEVETYLKDDPKVKVIHLVRDPRGVLLSRKKSGLDRSYQQSDKAFCDLVTKDIHTSMLLKKTYPGRVMTARYEDIAERPLDFSALLFSFVGLKMEPSLREFVWNMTSSRDQHKKEDIWHTYRADSKRTAGLWRESASYEFVSGVNRDCRQLLELMGYVPFASKGVMNNTNIPYYKDYKKVRGLWNTTMS